MFWGACPQTPLENCSPPPTITFEIFSPKLKIQIEPCYVSTIEGFHCIGLQGGSPPPNTPAATVLILTVSVGVLCVFRAPHGGGGGGRVCGRELLQRGRQGDQEDDRAEGEAGAARPGCPHKPPSSMLL